MATHLSLYLAAVLGALALVLLMPRAKASLVLPALGTLLGAAVLGVLWIVLAQAWSDSSYALIERVYYYIFSAIAIVSAVRVITHTKPVYAALWFVMVVVSTSGLMLTLAAEFMAFAMLIIYGGAILVTYMFVIMLASQGQVAAIREDTPVYDRVAREPVWAVAAGFLLLAVTSTVVFDPPPANYDAQFTRHGLPKHVAKSVAAEAGIQPETGQAMTADDVRVLTRRPVEDAEQANLSSQPELAPDTLSNPELVGLDLFLGHPLAIELAGVILLVALIGAVVIAKTRVPEEMKNLAEWSAQDSAAAPAQAEGGTP